ncbi:MAG: MFS transporter, partial [Flavobacteriaceae bacterium]
MTENQIQQGHPKGLYVLFMSEMWERFCFYGMRGLLTLYLIKMLMIGKNDSFLIYGAYAALVYLAPVLGGKIADALLGYRKAVIFGAVLMFIGEMVIIGGEIFSIGGDNPDKGIFADLLFWGMGFLIVGNGYFKANISSIVGKLYADDDPRRDSGFTIFYIGINIGALLATTICVYVGETYGFHYGFGLAGFGMLLGLVFFIAGQKHYIEKALPPFPEKLKEKIFGFLPKEYAVYLASFALIPAIYYLVNHNTLVGYVLGIVAVGIIIYLLVEGAKGGKVLLHRMIIFLILCSFNVVFWALFEQAGTSLTVFADTNVNREIFGFTLTAGNTQFFNPLYIIIFGSIFSMMWLKLTAI